MQCSSSTAADKIQEQKRELIALWHRVSLLSWNNSRLRNESSKVPQLHRSMNVRGGTFKIDRDNLCLLYAFPVEVNSALVGLSRILVFAMRDVSKYSQHSCGIAHENEAGLYHRGCIIFQNSSMAFYLLFHTQSRDICGCTRICGCTHMHAGSSQILPCPLDFQSTAIVRMDNELASEMHQREFARSYRRRISLSSPA